MNALLELTDAGLYCRAGGFYVDPWQSVNRAIITHAHSDHARFGSQHYITADRGERLLRHRLGTINLDTYRYGETFEINGVTASLHPAGHVLGSSQVRLEQNGEVWVVSGDYKLEADATCTPFEPIRCHTFITESTFGLPIYRWDKPAEIFASINAWWRANREAGKASVIFAYSLGKAQRILGGIDSTLGPIFTHGAVEPLVRAYRDSGVPLPETTPVSEVAKKDANWAGALIVAPPSADGTPWLRKFEPLSTAVASGWMQVRGVRRRRAVDRGFVLSDHADWPGLLTAIRETGATRILATHGSAGILAKYLREQGLDAGTITTRFGDDEEPAAETPS
ncbi:ligase-associated DNA damage response exonuclease [soil metagenome]